MCYSSQFRLRTFHMTFFIGWVLYLYLQNNIQNKGPHVVALLHHHHQWPMKAVFWELRTKPILEVTIESYNHCLWEHCRSVFYGKN